VKLTIFTPTYNRAHLLHEAYNSLCRQDCKNFEWLIIDDGSTDNTEELVKTWIDSNRDFPIRYEKVQNRGKMRAMNLAFDKAQGELFLALDSDDYLTNDAVSSIVSWEKTIANQKEKFAGIAGLKCHKDGSLIGTTFNGEYLDCSVAERERNNIFGDKCEVFYTNLLRKHHFQEFAGEKFISEGILWLEICYEENKVLRWFNKAIYKGDYLEDGYSANAVELLAKNPQGTLYNCKRLIEIKKPSYYEKLHIWHDYYLAGKKNGYSLKRIKQDLGLSYLDSFSLLIGHFISRLKRKEFELPK